MSDDATDAALARAHARTAAQRGRFTIGLGAVLTDGARSLRLIGCERDGAGQLSVLVDHGGTTTRIPFARICTDTKRLTPMTAIGFVSDPTPTDPLWEGLSVDQQREALALARHLRQVLTGSPDGNLERAIELGRVDARYDPRTVTDFAVRVDAKSKELIALGVRGASVSSLYRKLNAFKRNGVMGLVDKRWLRRTDPLEGIPAEVIATVGATIATRVAHSRLSVRKLLALSKIDLHQAGIGADLSHNQLRMLVGELTRGQAMHREARSRRTHSSRPQGVQGRLHASRPGELVQIDATPSNVHAWFPEAGWCPATILTAIDVYTRQILALRVVPGALSTRDSCLLLWDITQPTITRCGWPRHLRRWHGMPVLVRINSDDTRLPNERSDGGSDSRVVGAKRSLIPSTVVIDHGSEFDAEHFQSVCARNGIDVLFARPRTGSDKGIVESWHDTLDEALTALPGYKGANPQDHPEGAEEDAALTCADLQDMLWTWILTIYHDTPHEGLRDAASPRIKVSPNAAFDRFIEVGGHIEVAHDPYRLISFLSCKPDATIQADGIRLLRRVFVNDRVVELGNRMRRGVGAKAKALPVYYDRWDMTRIFLFDPFEHEWLCIPAATPGGAAVAPFSEAIARAAIRDTIRGSRAVTDEELHRREVELLAAFSGGVFAERRERRLHALEQARQVEYAAEIEGWTQAMRDLAFPPQPAREELLDGYEGADRDDAEVFAYDSDEVDGLAL
jgi:hypothetical protein